MVIILEAHNIGHSKQKRKSMYMCPIPNGFGDRAISLNNSKFFLIERLCAVSNTSIYHSSDKVGTVYLT
jgi:hypothetical protein